MKTINSATEAINNLNDMNMLLSNLFRRDKKTVIGASSINQNSHRNMLSVQIISPEWFRWKTKKTSLRFKEALKISEKILNQIKGRHKSSKNQQMIFTEKKRILVKNLAIRWNFKFHKHINGHTLTKLRITVQQTE